MQIDFNNRKLLKEWKKIKDFDIFQDINEFALVFFQKPYGICMRKYTSYPWCQENFFFGSYDELKEWYQTTDEIPFYVKEVVGQKFGKLTVLDFLYKHNSKGVRTLHANCKCDCGNTSEVDYRSLKHGDIVSCGCRTGGKEPKVSKPLTEEIIELWDFDKNEGIDPYKISQTSTQKYWWKDKEGNSYQLAPYAFAKEDKTSSSFPEQALFYYIKKEYSSTINRANFITSDGEILEIDIYIPAYNIGIEYDGVYWHSDKAERDTYKSTTLFDNGVFLIRIRENGLPDLEVSDLIINQCPYNSTNESDFVKTINQILNILNSRTKRSNYKELTYEEFDFNRNSIYSLFYNKPVKNSIKGTCVGRLWDTQRNGDLKPECVDINLNLPIYLTCNSKKTFYYTPQYIFEKIKTWNNKVFKCKNISEIYVCSQNDCCPFYNVNICKGEISCFNITNKQIPIIRCINKGISLFDKINNSPLSEYHLLGRSISRQEIKGLLQFKLYNNTEFEFEFGTTGAILINKDKSVYYGDSFAEKVYCKGILPKKVNEFSFYITDDVISKIVNGYLLIYKKLFKAVKDNFGWFVYSLLILKFDEKGNITKQANKIYSTIEMKKILYSYSLKEYKILFDQILSESN